MSVASALGPFARTPPRDGGEPRCELCAAPAGEAHRHVVDLERRVVCCACDTCSRLFVQSRSGSRFRTVPDRVLSDPGRGPSAQEWASLAIPVRLAFLFRSSRIGRWVAAYPGPAGVTEAELPEEAWGAVAGRLPLAAEVADDVEALLFHADRDAAALECLLVPVDACYALAGLLRRCWKGFDGGSEARSAIAGALGRLRARARPLRREAGDGGAG